MDQELRQRLIQAWIEHHKAQRASGKVPDATFWAWEKLDTICDRDPNLCFSLILEILAVDKSEAVIENLSAGPLEDLLVRHGRTVIERIETEAKVNPDFRLLLGGVWRNTIKKDVWKRVQALVETRW